MINIAFTGSRSVTSSFVQQKLFFALECLLQKPLASSEPERVHFLHGGCVGADELFHRCLGAFLLDNPWVAKFWSLDIYPSNLARYVADLSTVRMGISVMIHPPLPPLKRNTLMAQECHKLWAAPQNYIRTRSGTWHTIGQVEKFGNKHIEYFVEE